MLFRSDKLNVVYDIDENLHIQIPSLIIQPLVENSIQHGILEGSGAGKVKISVRSHDIDEVYVVIEDDGVGITQAVIDRIYEGTMKENKIGLSNVNNRLKYIYGNRLMIERLPKGTKIGFILRDIKKEID